MPRNRRFATVEKSYITDIERERCKKVAAAYAELYELESILVLDVGRYGFVKLQYYTPEYGFNDVTLTAHLTYRTCHNGFGGFTVYRLVRFDAECVSCACLQVLRSVRGIGV